jgi:MSHA biogenesis protein MshJ
MLFAAVLAITMLCSEALFFHPQRSHRAEIRSQIDGVKATLAALDTQAEAIRALGQKDPDRELRIQQQQLQAELNRLDNRLKALTVDLISPRDMAEVLRDLLLRQKGMRLAHLENLPAEDLLPAAEKQSAGPDDGARVKLYRHRMRIVFSGTYMQSIAYLRSLETLDRKLYWDDLEIVVDDHPLAQISLTVHTLSLRKGWIGA